MVNSLDVDAIELSIKFSKSKIKCVCFKKDKSSRVFWGSSGIWLMIVGVVPTLSEIMSLGERDEVCRWSRSWWTNGSLTVLLKALWLFITNYLIKNNYLTVIQSTVEGSVKEPLAKKILCWSKNGCCTESLQRNNNFWTIAQLTSGAFPRDRTPLDELSAFPPQGPDQIKFWGHCFTPLEVPARWVVPSKKHRNSEVGAWSDHIRLVERSQHFISDKLIQLQLVIMEVHKKANDGSDHRSSLPDLCRSSEPLRLLEKVVLWVKTYLICIYL